MVCSCHSSCLDLTVSIVYFQMEGCTLRLYHICQGGYVAMHKIDLDLSERKLFRDCVEKIWMRGEPDTFNKVVHITV